MDELNSRFHRSFKGAFDPLGGKFGRCEQRLIACVGISFRSTGLLVSEDLADEEQ